MKHWQETSRILQMLAQLSEQGRSAALATVIHLEGSAYRRAGAKMLIADDGTMAGSVSGGCLEADVREVALSVIGHGIPQLLHYDTGSVDETPFGLGLGCDGAVDIFVQRASATDFLETSRRIALLLQGEETFAVSTIVRGAKGLGRSIVVGTLGEPVGSMGDAKLDTLVTSCARNNLGNATSQLSDVEGHQIFTEIQVPPPSLVIVGAGDDTRPLVVSATDVGFRVTVVDHRPGYLTGDRYPAGTHLVQARADSDIAQLRLGPGSYAVVKTHSLEHDRGWIQRLLATETPYIGVLGSRARIQEMLRELDAEDDGRIFGPVGLDLGADGPEQIAVSVVAELLALLSGHEPGHLRAKEGFIHAD
jgi:xanthine/CO dehydrogenase XdhC/CoxF family maturation factor